MKYLIIGLGNIGAKYHDTRHNIGFSILDTIADRNNLSFTIEKYAEVSEIRFKGRTLVLIKPSTFMNLSGKAVNYWKQKAKIKNENLLIITDDIALPFGCIRLRKKGSSGGHNGLKHISTILGSDNYSRLRFGVGDNFTKGNQVAYVLNSFSEIEKELLPERIDLAIKVIENFSTLGVDRTMNFFNGK